MTKKFFAMVCIMALMIGLLPSMALPAKASLEDILSVYSDYQVGFARVDINPYVVEDDPSSGIMALPLRGLGDVWNRLSTGGLLDDNGDGVVDQNDGLKATCVSITDGDGKTVLMITVDIIGSDLITQVGPVVVKRVNEAIADGELSGLQEIQQTDIFFSGTHTHSAPDTTVYRSNGKTGTNDAGVDLSVVNENLGIWIERTVEDICDSVMLALKDRAAAELVKDQLSAGDAVSPVLKDKPLTNTRHYFTEVDGDKFVVGDNFNYVTKDSYQNPDDYRSSHGVDPKQITAADETVYLLRFEFADTQKLPIILTSWAAHPGTSSTDYYENSGRNAISADYVNAYRHMLEYGVDVTINSTIGYVKSWTLGTTQKYRVAFFQATGGNVNARSYEQIDYTGPNGDEIHYGNEWIDVSAIKAQIKGRACSFGAVLAVLAQECVDDGLNERSVTPGAIKTAQLFYHTDRKLTGASELSYKAGLACQEATKAGTVSYPFQYTDPDTGESFFVGSKFHTSRLLACWDQALGAPASTGGELTLGAILLGQDVAFVAASGEAFNFYYKDTTLEGEQRYADSNNLWNDLIDEATYGKPFVLGYCNGANGYIPNYDSYTYNEGSTTRVLASYEVHQSAHGQGTGEAMVRTLGDMLTTLAEQDDLTYSAPCAHCGENQLWQPYNGESRLNSGHYYLFNDVNTSQIIVSGGQTVCLDLNGHTLTGQARGIYTADTTKDVLNIMDSSTSQTGTILGCGALYGSGRGIGGGTVLINDGDVMNLYGGTIGFYERTGYSVSNGGTLLINGTLNMYGGRVTGGVASSFTGTYFSGTTVVTADRVGGGGSVLVRGTMNLYGGEICSGKVKAITGTANADGTYTEESVEITNRGSCVWIATTGTLMLSNDASVEHIQFQNGNPLTISGIYTGTAELQYNTLSDLTNGTVVGSGLDADASLAVITLADAPGKTVAVKGETLVVDDLPYTYSTCRYCGECRWVPMTDADMDALGATGMKPGHYVLAEDITGTQFQLNSDGTAPGTYCVDLAGHTFLSNSRTFLAYANAVLNIFDSVGTGQLIGTTGTTTNGGALFINPGGVINFYGGTAQRSTANSTYNNEGGVVRVKGGTFRMYGGTLLAGNSGSYGGAIHVSNQNGQQGSFQAFGGEITMGTAATAGDCVYIGKGSSVILSGTPKIGQICFAESSADTLTVQGTFTGTVTLRYPDAVTLNHMTAIGSSEEAVLSVESITLADVTCKQVGIYEEKLVVEDAHNYASKVTPPTCTQKGYTTFTCICGDSYTADETAVLGHSYKTVTVDVTCTADGSITDTCSRCGDTKVQTIPATGHSYEAVVTAPTCTEAGFTTYTCACGDTYTADETAALGHSYKTVTVDVTCTTDGSITDTCSRCGDTKVQTIPATGHSYQAVITAPTCTEVGYTTYTCTCGDHYVDDETEPTGHDWETGSRICSVCGCLDAYTAPCVHCGEGQWISLTDADIDAIGATGLKPGHYVLAEDITGTQFQLNSDGTAPGTYCVDLAGHTFLSNSRTFLAYANAVLNIFDSVGTGQLIGTTGTTTNGGALFINPGGVINFYGGTAQRSTANSAYNNEGGVVRVKGGTFRMYGGTLLAGNSGSYGGAIHVSNQNGQQGSFQAFGGEITMGTAATAGDCVYIGKGSSVILSGTPKIGQICFAESSADTLTVQGTFTGTVTLRYPDAVTLNHMTAIGSSEEAVLSVESITLADVTCKQVGIYEEKLVVEDAHNYTSKVTPPTCTTDGIISLTCAVCGNQTDGVVPATGHCFENGICGNCGAEDPDDLVIPTLALKAPALEFKDMICVIAFFTAENLDDVVEMGMITYTEKVDVVDVNTAAHVIPGATYDPSSGRYFSSSQGIHAKYLGDTVYLACYAKLSDGSYVYTKLASYGPLTYAKNQLDKSSDMKLKQLCAAMLNYGAAAQNYFGYNTGSLANSTLTAEQIALPEVYNADMAQSAPAIATDKQGIFANNKGFSVRKPAVSFEGAFSINYFFTPAYTPVDGITLYYWTEADANAADVLTIENATGSIAMKDEGGQFRGDIEGIAAKDLAKAVYVAAVYSDGTTTWTSGVLGYSVGAYCGSQAKGTGTMAELAMATAVYGYHAKQYFG